MNKMSGVNGVTNLPKAIKNYILQSRKSPIHINAKIKKKSKE